MAFFSYISLLVFWGVGFFRYGTARFLFRKGFRSPFLWPFLLIPSFLYRRPLGERLLDFFQSVGVLGIKVGQVLSVRVDMVGEEVASVLQQLQDRIPPVSASLAKKAVEKSLGVPLEKVFQSFGEEAAASASIAQVHDAVLWDGRRVAVKIVRPGVRRRVLRDLQALCFFSRGLLFFRKKKLKRFKLLNVLETLRKSLSQELDMRFEAAAMDEMRLFFEEDKSLVIPEVIWEHTTEEVLVAQWVEGTPIGEVLDKPLPFRQSLVRRLAVVFFKMVYAHGFFHADWHPGNLLIGAAGEIILMDFGLTGRLDEETRYYLADMTRAFITEDYQRAAQVHLQAGWVPPETNMGDFSLACRFIARPVFNRRQKEVSIGRLLANLFEVTGYFSMEVQEKLLLLQKTLLQIEGIGRQLAPEENIWHLASPLIEEHFKRLALTYKVRKILQKYPLLEDVDPHQLFSYLKDVVQHKKPSSQKRDHLRAVLDDMLSNIFPKGRND